MTTADGLPGSRTGTEMALIAADVQQVATGADLLGDVDVRVLDEGLHAALLLERGDLHNLAKGAEHQVQGLQRDWGVWLHEDALQAGQQSEPPSCAH